MGGLQRLVTLPPAPESAPQARRFVTDVLSAAAAEHFADTAALLTSELVTNGIVHAHTEMQLVVEATQRWVRVEVVDGNPMLPARRGYDEQALTGRGLEMVELLADAFGIQPLEDDGKRVWFRLGAMPAAHPAEDAVGDRPVDTVPVRLVNLPVALYNAWQMHADAILREAVIVAFDDADGGDVPEEHVLAGTALAALAAETADLFTRDAADADHVDVVARLPVSTVAKFPVLRDVLRRCSERSAAGDLLVPPSLPEIQAVRRWVCDEVGRQGQGLPPRPWQELDVEDVPVDPTSADAIEGVRAAAVAQIAADGWNRIIAVSPAAARLLGWPADELEGRRLVTIIPPALREAHVAGFTRQLLGGGSRILGRLTPVPAMHRDGSVVPVTLEIERCADSGGRPVFVATLRADSHN